MLDGAMTREAFDIYVETQLAPTLSSGDVVILDNLSAHKSPRAARALKGRSGHAFGRSLAEKRKSGTCVTI